MRLGDTYRMDEGTQEGFQEVVVCRPPAQNPLECLLSLNTCALPEVWLSEASARHWDLPFLIYFKQAPSGNS